MAFWFRQCFIPHWLLNDMKSNWRHSVYFNQAANQLLELKTCRNGIAKLRMIWLNVEWSQWMNQPASKKRLTEYWSWLQWMKDGLASLDWMIPESMNWLMTFAVWFQLNFNSQFQKWMKLIKLKTFSLLIEFRFQKWNWIIKAESNLGKWIRQTVILI